ncbi:MAG: patatin-like phospholipase family protein [Planctomycetes bacterium]|nr:patatin-like phospholipase family protein [Planctomycetota bacterium]
MEITDFTEAVGVVHTLDELNDYWTKKRPVVSDIIDGEGHQYVDLVMEGGGVLGIALIGYTYALESVGIRFLGVGGTSAGAITATMIAALDKPANAKSVQALEILAELEMFEFVDGDSDAKDFVKTMLEGAGPVKLGWKAMQVLDNLREDLGLNPGDCFFKWVATQLKGAGIRTVADLNKRFRDLPPDLRLRSGKSLSADEAAACLKIVAADVTTETKAVFPEMANLYFKEPNKVNPAHFVRASMSIPLFFHPYRVKRLPKGVPALREWKKVGYKGPVPKEIVFIDGGIMSNFPVDLFHDPNAKGMPSAPTFGARLGTARDEVNKIEKPTQLLMSVFNAARHCNDFDFIARNPDFARLVTEIPTGPHNWLNFFLTPEAKVDLFTRGVKAAVAWLKGFNWPDYKQLRGKLAKVK